MHELVCSTMHMLAYSAKLCTNGGEDDGEGEGDGEGNASQSDSASESAAPVEKRSCQAGGAVSSHWPQIVAAVLLAAGSLSSQARMPARSNMLMPFPSSSSSSEGSNILPATSAGARLRMNS